VTAFKKKVFVFLPAHF